ncbi:MAG: glycoside hydrolase family 2, partial [Actinomycetota bacterium]|nr:glycoside hydrolase family 2 [Actinomycetota bacterium]
MTMLTPWAEDLDPAAPLPEYPRPQLVRGDWLNLNGPWQFAITPFEADADPLAVADPRTAPGAWDGEIIVPFSPEVPLSGVGRTLGDDETLWYRRSFALPRALGAGERVLLHLGAVDQSCRMAVDGVEVGGHSGGYLPFSLDVTRALGAPGEADDGEHELTVAVRDVTDASWLARGKQSSRRGGIWYSPQSGIWQTVWLEIVPRVAVDGLVLTPVGADARSAGETSASPSGPPRSLDVTVRSEHAPLGTAARVTVSAHGAVVVAADVPVGEATRLDLLGDVRAWSPEDPFLYDVDVTLGEDSVRGYVGMRTFGTGRDAAGHERLLLNGEPYLPVGLLDQGYWPDGGYTAPSDAALAFDVELAKELGYTMLRKHIKIEPLRWYHHCDRLGILVWQDAVNGGGPHSRFVVSAPAVAPFVRISDRRHGALARR